MTDCGAAGLAERAGCAAAQALVEIVGRFLLGAVLWFPSAVARPGRVGPGTAVFLVFVVAGLAVRWTLRTGGPLSADLRAAAVTLRPHVKRWPRTWAYVRACARGAARLYPHARRLGSWAWRRQRRPVLLLAAGLAAYLAVGAAWAVVGRLPGPLPLALVVVALHRLGAGGQSSGREWWRERTLVPAMTAAGILRRPRDGERLRLGRRGQPVHTDRGTRIKLALPGAVHLEDVQRGRTRLAAALGVPARDLAVSQDVDDPANVVSLFVASHTSGSVRVPLDQPAEASPEHWGDPLRLGEDQQGAPVYFQTGSTHTLVAGLTRAGKTVACQRIAARAALDPAVTIYLVNGKSSALDWDPLGPLCELYVDRVGDDIADRVREVFTALMDLTAARNADRQHRGPWPPALLLIEEWGNVRGAIAAAAGAQVLSDLDKLLVRLVAMSASAGVHIVLIQQRITKDNFPTSQTANVAQRLVMRCANRGDVATALGEEPTEALPQQVGHGLLTNDSGRQQVVRVDGLEGTDWEAVCARGAALRGVAPTATESPVSAPRSLAVDLTKSPPLAAPAPPPAVVDPVHAAVVSVLQDSHPDGLPAAALLDRLPGHLRPASAAVLGKRLATCPQVAQTRDSSTGRRWHLAVTTPSGDSTDGSPHAQKRCHDGSQGGGGALPSLPTQPATAPSSGVAP